MPEKKYFVTRQMIGDKPYFDGDVRTMDEHDAAGLVASGALEEYDAKKHAKKVKEKAARDAGTKADDKPADDGGDPAAKKGAAKKAAAKKE